LFSTGCEVGALIIHTRHGPMKRVFGGPTVCKASPAFRLEVIFVLGFIVIIV